VGSPDTVAGDTYPDIQTISKRGTRNQDRPVNIPIDSPRALLEIKKAMNTITGNEQSLQNNQTARFDMGLDQEDLRVLYAQIKDGKESMFDVNYVITSIRTHTNLCSQEYQKYGLS